MSNRRDSLKIIHDGHVKDKIKYFSCQAESTKENLSIQNFAKTYSADRQSWLRLNSSANKTAPDALSKAECEQSSIQDDTVEQQVLVEKDRNNVNNSTKSLSGEEPDTDIKWDKSIKNEEDLRSLSHREAIDDHKINHRRVSPTIINIDKSISFGAKYDIIMRTDGNIIRANKKQNVDNNLSPKRTIENEYDLNSSNTDEDYFNIPGNTETGSKNGGELLNYDNIDSNRFSYDSYSSNTEEILEWSHNQLYDSDNIEDYSEETSKKNDFENLEQFESCPSASRLCWYIGEDCTAQQLISLNSSPDERCSKHGTECPKQDLNNIEDEGIDCGTQDKVVDADTDQCEEDDNANHEMNSGHYGEEINYRTEESNNEDLGNYENIHHLGDIDADCPRRLVREREDLRPAVDGERQSRRDEERGDWINAQNGFESPFLEDYTEEGEDKVILRRHLTSESESDRGGIRCSNGSLLEGYEDYINREAAVFEGIILRDPSDNDLTDANSVMSHLDTQQNFEMNQHGNLQNTECEPEIETEETNEDIYGRALENDEDWDAKSGYSTFSDVSNFGGHELLQKFWIKSDESLRQSIRDGNIKGSLGMTAFLLMRLVNPELISEEKRRSFPDFPEWDQMVSRSTSALWQNMPEVKKCEKCLSLTKKEICLQEAIFEIMTTEARYVHSLSVFVGHFLSNLKPYMKEKDHKMVFQLITPIKEAAIALFKDLILLWNKDIMLEEICNVLELHYKNAKPFYMRYAKNSETILSDWKRLFQEDGKVRKIAKALSEREEAEKLAFDDFLPLPVIRMSRIPLLIKAVLSFSEINSKLYWQYREAHEFFENFIGELNFEIGRMKNSEDILNLQYKLVFPVGIPYIPVVSSRRFLEFHSEAKKIVKWRHKSRILYLFNDFFMITKKIEGDKLLVVNYCPRPALKMTELSHNRLEVTMLNDANGDHFSVAFQFDDLTHFHKWVEALRPLPPKFPHSDPNNRVQMISMQKYEAASTNELSFEIGEIINVLDSKYVPVQEDSDPIGSLSNPEMTVGEKLVDGSIGWFPTGFCEVIHSAKIRRFNNQILTQLRRSNEEASMIFDNSGVEEYEA